jgi:hypothetical protein
MDISERTRNMLLLTAVLLIILFTFRYLNGRLDEK